MPAKRRKIEGTGSNSQVQTLGVSNAKPLSAIAAARLRAEVAAKSAAIQETTLEPLPAPSSPPPEDLVSEYEDSDAEPEPVTIKRNLKLCNWRNDPKDILSDTDSELTINLEKHTTIALIGYFTFKVLRGAVNVNGANIGAVTREGQKAVTHHAAVPGTHPISKIRGLDGRNQVQFASCREPAPFSSLNPLFADIWNAKTRNQKPRTFSVITESDADPLLRPLCSESTPEDWLRTIEECASKPSTILITGSHSSGKNCFARRLLNRYLTGIGKAAKPVPSICFLDLDPESPEYTPHGQISLAMIRELTLGPSFTRPANLSKQEESPRNETIRAHAIPSNLANYQEYYQACIDDLFLTYKNLYSRDSSLPLLINTPGFLYTTNFNILEQLLARSKPHRIVHLGDTRNVDADTAAKLHVLKTISTQQRSTVHEITAQVPLLAPLRSKADLKAMHMQSYFHFTGTPQAPTWSTKTLSHLAPWEFSYQETKERTQDLVGFLSYAEPIKPSSLIHSLNGSLVQIIQTSSARIPTPYTALPRTAKLQIPYFAESTTTGMVDALDPRTSKLVCTALIRGFDPERRVVQVLVPKVCEDLLRELVPERTVFVAGCCEAPEWAYMEDAYAAQNAAEGARAGADSGELPLWVEKESVMDDMGYLNTLRRVRKFQT